MPNRPFRFLHSSDFHLESVPYGLAEVPDHLRDTLIDTAYRAAQRVFDTAINEHVSFVILSGDILNNHQAGLRGPAFLAQQFARLAEHHITVFWAGGRIDPPEAWPAAFPLPDNVKIFPGGRVTEFVYHEEDMPLARLVGISGDGASKLNAGDFSPDPAGLFSIGVAYGTADAAALQVRGMHYWALGGQHARTTLYSSPGIAHDCGTPQGRDPDERGPHGCTIVGVDEAGRSRMSFSTTSVLEWLSETIVVDTSMRRENVEHLLTERIRALAARSPQTNLLISWSIAGSGPLFSELRRGKLRAELLDWLRIEFGLGSPSLWSVALEIESQSAVPAAMLEQQTILGDFLRAVRHFETHTDEPLDLQSLLAEAHISGVLAQATAIDDLPTRKRVLHEAAMLGMELLGGDSTDGGRHA